MAAKLFGMWPSTNVGEVTMIVYVKGFEKLGYPEAVNDALDRLFLMSRRMPSFAEVYDEYVRCRDRYLPKELPAPEPTPEERREIALRAREMLARLSASMEPPE